MMMMICITLDIAAAAVREESDTPERAVSLMMMLHQLLKRLLPRVPGHLIQFHRSFCVSSDILSILQSPKCIQSLKSQCNPHDWQQIKLRLDDLNALKDLAGSSDDSLKKEIQEERENLLLQLKSLEGIIVEALVGDDDSSVDSAILEIGNGVGGQEAMLFAAELMHVYQVYCAWKGWNCEVVNCTQSEIGGVHDATIEINGSLCFKNLRHEAGVHRVQRVPKTEKSGRIHTSTVTVAVIPLVPELTDIEIPAKDLKMQFVRSTGAGGQHVNKTESCVKLFHLPTGIQVECQETRVQAENKKIALDKLKRLLLLRNKEKLLEQYEKTKKSQIASPDRSEKIRTYNFNQDRITEHRLGENYHEIREFMRGQPDRLQEIIDSLEAQRVGLFLKQLSREIN